MNKNEYRIHPRKGVLVVYEGISGSGKSESSRHLLRHLQANGCQAAIVEWNSNPFIRGVVQRLVRRNLMTSLLYSMLQWISFLMDYFLIVLPRLRKNHVVIADRYMYTSITRDAANGAGRFMGRMLSRFIRKPDLVFFYDTPPKICYERIQARGKVLFHTNKWIHRHKLLLNKDLYYLSKVRNEYIRLFSDKKVSCGTNIIRIEHEYTHIIQHVESYMDAKARQSNARVYNN